jgi:hypothetical protein
MDRARPWIHPCMAGLALQRHKRPQQTVLAAAIRYLLNCLELEVTVVVVNESDFSVHTWTVARPLANSIFDLSLVDFFDYSLGADNTGMSFLGYCPRD